MRKQTVKKRVKFYSELPQSLFFSYLFQLPPFFLFELTLNWCECLNNPHLNGIRTGAPHWSNGRVERFTLGETLLVKGT